MATPPVEIEELQEFLNATSPDVEAESNIYLEAATDLIEAKCGPMVVRSFTESIQGDHYSGPYRGCVLVSNYPVTAFTSITMEPDYDDYDLEYVAARSQLDIGKLYVGCYRHWATVVYSAGRTTIPSALKLATLVTAGHLWEAQRGTSSGAFGPVLGSDEAPPGFEAAGPLARGEILPRRAMELIQPYIQKSFW